MSLGPRLGDDLASLLRSLPTLRTASVRTGEVQCDLVLDIGAGPFCVELAFLAAPSPGAVADLARRKAPMDSGRHNLLVSDRLSMTARRELNELGWSWWDRRGHLHLEAPGLLVDCPVAAETAPSGPSRNPGRPSASAVWLEVTTALLADPHQSLGVRELERRLGRAASAVSRVLADLRDRALLTRAGLPLLPDLFWEVAGQWQAELIAVSRAPLPGDPGLDLDWADSDLAGWALTDAAAAAAWGAPLAVRSDAPLEFYVPDRAALRAAVLHLESTSWEHRGAAVAIAPVPLAVAPRFDPASQPAPGTHWLLAHPVVVALDLAQDVGRGRQALDLWSPPSPFTRVW